MTAVRVRPAEPADVADILRFITDLAVYEREPDAVKVTAGQLRTGLFGPSPRVFAHVAEVGGAAAGMAIWFLNYSTWEGRHGIYVEDLYVDPGFRGAGVGRALLAELARLCARHGYARLELSVLDWNTPAIDFYRRIGAVAMADWTVQRFSGPALEALAE